MEQGSYDLAIAAIEKSLELDDDNAYAYLNLAICNAKKGDKEFCCVALNAAEKSKFRLRLKKEIDALKAENCK